MPTTTHALSCDVMGKATSSDKEVLFVGTHETLFEQAESTRCDACGDAIHADGERGEYEVPGSGAYLWNRGDAVQVEIAPLCPSCASAIGMTALARWEIEEEEG